MTDREAMKLALEALEMLAKWEHPASHITTKSGRIYPHHVAANAATALRTAIEQAEKQEPVAWATMLGNYSHVSWGKDRPDYPIRYEVPLYTTPPAAQRQPLTDEEMLEILGDIDADTKRLPPGIKAFARAIEAKLKEKNHE